MTLQNDNGYNGTESEMHDFCLIRKYNHPSNIV